MPWAPPCLPLVAKFGMSPVGAGQRPMDNPCSADTALSIVPGLSPFPLAYGAGWGCCACFVLTPFPSSESCSTCPSLPGLDSPTGCSDQDADPGSFQKPQPERALQRISAWGRPTNAKAGSCPIQRNSLAFRLKTGHVEHLLVCGNQSHTVPQWRPVAPDATSSCVVLKASTCQARSATPSHVPEGLGRPSKPLLPDDGRHSWSRGGKRRTPAISPHPLTPLHSSWEGASSLPETAADSHGISPSPTGNSRCLQLSWHRSSDSWGKSLPSEAIEGRPGNPDWAAALSSTRNWP